MEVVPDIPNEVISRIKKAGRKNRADFVLIEIGGTVGEYQNMLFLEAARMMKIAHPKNVLFILVSYLPVPKIIGEMKTKPTQYAVRTLNTAGIQPDLILARSVVPLDRPRKKKISIFCSVAFEDIISAPDVDSIYEIPVNFERDNLGKQILKRFELKPKKNDLKDWKALVKTIKKAEKTVKIGVAGKYFETGRFTLMDSYISIIEAIRHASFSFKTTPEIFWLSAEKYEKSPNLLKELKDYDGIIVPGGFGNRGIEGKIKVIEFCRKNKIPYLGLCLGMQLAVVEFARNVCRIKGASSTEFNKKCPAPVIDVMPEQKALLKEKKYGATMRLGAYRCKIMPETCSYKAYKNHASLRSAEPCNHPHYKNGISKIKRSFIISERHRHRYELNNAFRDVLEKKGLVIAGINPERNLVEIIEVKNHPFFVGTQFHPEFKSRPLNPHPLFKEFIQTCIKNK